MNKNKVRDKKEKNEPNILASLFSGERQSKQRCATWLPLLFFINNTITGFKAETIMENCTGLLTVSSIFCTTRVLQLSTRSNKEQMT